MTEKEKKKMNKLLISLDLGTSLSKIVYLVNNEKVGYMVMEPEHLALPESSAEHLPISAETGLPEDNAWVRFTSNGDCHVVGRLARDYRAFVNFKIEKWRIATPKILAVIGAIAEREKLGAQLSLDLAVLMPYGEIKSAPQLKKQLTTALKSGFYFRNKEVFIELERYQCVPEATGTAIFTLKTNESKGQNLLYLMFGHRNTSLLCFRRGSFSRSESGTTNLGFYDVINKMADKVSGLDKNRFINAINTKAQIEKEAKYTHVYWPETYTYHYQQTTTTSINWAALTSASDNSERQAEIELLKRAYQISLDEHWALIAHWLSSSLPELSEIDKLVYGGGGSLLFANKILQYFPEGLVHVPSNYEQQMWSAFGLNSQSNQILAKSFVKQNLLPRFVDVWYFFLFFSGFGEKQEVA